MFLRRPILLAGLFLFFLGNQSIAQTEALSSNAKISLLTCGPGDEFASLFGHSALWVSDPINDIDRVYNYGTYDFETSNFILKFLKGTLVYHLSVVSFPTFLQNYVVENRYVVEQELNLSHTERQELFKILEFDYLPENRNYRYDVYLLNCSTLIRDRIFLVTKRFELPEEEKNITYRMTLQVYTHHAPWVSLGLNLLLGAKSDVEADTWAQMYLPEKMHYAFDHASSVDGESLVASSTSWHQPEEVSIKPSWSYLPNIILAAFALLLAFYTRSEARKRKWSWQLDLGILVIFGLIGCVFFFMSFVSLHQASHLNFNLVWAHPLLLLLPAALLIKPLKLIAYRFSRINAILIAIYLLANVLANFQDMPTAGLFLAILIMLRLFRIGDLHNSYDPKPKT